MHNIPSIHLPCSGLLSGQAQLPPLPRHHLSITASRTFHGGGRLESYRNPIKTLQSPLKPQQKPCLCSPAARAIHEGDRSHTLFVNHPTYTAQSEPYTIETPASLLFVHYDLSHFKGTSPEQLYQLCRNSDWTAVIGDVDVFGVSFLRILLFFALHCFWHAQPVIDLCLSPSFVFSLNCSLLCSLHLA